MNLKNKSVQTVVLGASNLSIISMQDKLLDKPKNLIDVKGQTILELAIQSYALNQKMTNVVILEEEEMAYETSLYILRKFPDVTPRLITKQTRGAMLSALLGLEGFDLEAPLVVAPGDSCFKADKQSIILANFLNLMIGTDSDAGTVSFNSNLERWSYIVKDENAKIEQVVEKEVVSNIATSGLFYFKTVKGFLDSSAWCLKHNINKNGVYYVSSTLNYMISQQLKIVDYLIDFDDFCPLSSTEDISLAQSAQI